MRHEVTQAWTEAAIYFLEAGYTERQERGRIRPVEHDTAGTAASYAKLLV